MSSLQFSNFEKSSNSLPRDLHPPNPPWNLKNHQFLARGAPPPGPLGNGLREPHKNRPGLGEPHKNAFFEKGLKTYIIRRSSLRASIWCRTYRKWCNL